MKYIYSLLILALSGFATAASWADSQPPSTPQLSAKVYSSSTAEIFWTRATDDNADLIYILKRNGRQVFRGDALSFMDRNLISTGSYNYELTVLGRDGRLSNAVNVGFKTSDKADEPSFVSRPVAAPTLPRPVAAPTLAPVTGLRAEIYSASEAKLFWDSTESVGTVYSIRYNGVPVASVSEASYFIDSGLLGRGNVTFEVAARPRFGSVGYSAPVSIIINTGNRSNVNTGATIPVVDTPSVAPPITTPITPPVTVPITRPVTTPTTPPVTTPIISQPRIQVSAPVNVRLATYSGQNVELFWSIPSDLEGIVATEIYRNGDLIGTAPGNRFFDNTRVFGENYTYELVAINNLGDASLPARFPAAAAAPAALSVIDPAYFKEVALNAEFGNTFTAIRKWTSNINYVVLGQPSAALEAELERVIAELNELIDIQFVRVFSQSEANLPIYFGSGQFYANNIEPNAEELINFNNGLVWIYWNRNIELVRGSIFIDTVRNTDLTLQKHVVREEVTQALGLLNDSFKYRDSIFYQDPSRVTEFSEIDRNVIQTLYNPALTPGLSEARVDALLAASANN